MNLTSLQSIIHAGVKVVLDGSDMGVCVFEPIQQTAQCPVLLSRLLFFLWLPNQGITDVLYSSVKCLELEEEFHL